VYVVSDETIGTRAAAMNRMTKVELREQFIIEAIERFVNIGSKPSVNGSGNQMKQNMEK
jgi:hypothetical protein